jgi:CheY-like chemotaxis protein
MQFAWDAAREKLRRGGIPASEARAGALRGSTYVVVTRIDAIRRPASKTSMTIGRAGETRMVSAPSEVVHCILLVDDDVDEREALECFLETEGLEVCCASDGQEALYALRNGPRPCLILLDLNMAGMDGWEFRRRQLLWPRMANIPVAVLSGAPELRASTRMMEAAEVWRKPLPLHLVLRAVRDHCQGHSEATG